MDLSIIIINYHSESLLVSCIESIISSRPKLSYEILIIDNGSDEKGKKTITQLKKKYASIPIRSWYNQQNLGYGKANNQGVRYAEGDYILLLNVDTNILNDAITTLYHFIKKNKKADIVGPMLLNRDYTRQPSVGLFYTIPVVFAMLFLKGDIWGITRKSPRKVTEVDWISGACMMMKKDIYNALSGFDENIFMYMEEVDFLYRAKKKGYRVYYTPDARIVHIGAATGEGRKSAVIQIYKGLMYFYKKHYSFFSRIILLYLLYIKAYLSIIIGKILRRNSLVKTYNKALSSI